MTETTFPAFTLASGNDPARLDDAKRTGWNWGGFLLPYLWLVGHGRTSAGLTLLLTSAVPLVWFFHLILYPAASIYLGLNGYELAWRSQPYHSVEQMREREREWTMWGIALNVVFVFALLIFLFYLRAILDEVFKQMEGLGA